MEKTNFSLVDVVEEEEVEKLEAVEASFVSRMTMMMRMNLTEDPEPAAVRSTRSIR